MKAIVVSQSPIDYEDLAKVGVKTAVVMPQANQIRTERHGDGDRERRNPGQTPTREKMAEVISSVMRIVKKK